MKSMKPVGEFQQNKEERAEPVDRPEPSDVQVEKQSDDQPMGEKIDMTIDENHIEAEYILENGVWKLQEQKLSLNSLNFALF